MKKMGIIRRALSLAIIMVVTLLLQGSDTVYGAEISDSEEWDMILDSEDVDEIVPESDELLVEETLDEPILAEETLDEQTIQDEEMELKSDSEVSYLTFDANGGYFDELSPNAVSWEGNEGAYTSQTLEYIDLEDGTFAVPSMGDILNNVSRDGYRFTDLWVEENDGDIFGVSGELHPYPYIENKDRVYKATWIRNMDEIPQIDEEYGIDGISYIKDGNNVDLSFRIDKEKYESISVGADEKLLLLYSVGAKKRLRGLDEKATKDEDGYYNCLDWQEIDKNENCTIEMQLFDSIPTEPVDIRLGLGYVIIKSSESEPVWSGSDFNVLAESSPRYFENYTYRKYTLPITSVSLKNEIVLSPVIGGNEVTSDITLNAGADISKLRLVYATNANEIVDKPDFLEYCFIEDGKLKVKASGNYQAGNEINIVFYDIENTHSPIQQQFDISENVRKIITAAPTWTSKTLTASLTSASDVAFNLKVGAPSGESFVGGNYYIGVGVTYNAQTAKGLKSGLVISNVHEIYFEINDDGSFPEVTINPFRYDNPDTGAIVTKLGEGCGTSMDATVFLVMTDGDAPDKGGTVLATTDANKVKNLTVSTKNPYYADKITLRKGVTSLYAGDYEGKIVATIDFGMNTTYTRAADWEITNSSDLAAKDVYADKSGNGILVSTRSNTKPGTYTVNVETVSEGGVPAKASISIKVLSTVSEIYFDGGIGIYRKSGKSASYTVKPVVFNQIGEIITKPTLKYEIGVYIEDDYTFGSVIEAVPGLSIKNGKITVAKGFEKDPEKDYIVKAISSVDNTVYGESYITIIEDKINIKGFAFPDTEIMLNSETKSMTLAEYYALGWTDEIYNSMRGATLGVHDIENDFWPLNNCGVAIADTDDDPITMDLLKEVKIPNPEFVNKTGKITLSATTIDGTKFKKTINIVKESNPDEFDTLYVYDSTMHSEPESIENGGTYPTDRSVDDIYYIWLSKDTTNDTRKTITGDKLTVKGAKIIENHHNDCIGIKLTSGRATITRKRGSKVIGTYCITNSAFNLAMPKVTSENKKIYTNAGDVQTYTYTFDKEYEGVKDVNIVSSNKSFMNAVSDVNMMKVYVPENASGSKTQVSIELKEEATKCLKAGKYTFTMELLDEDGKALCKPVKATIKLEKLKKNLKYTAKYTMSNKDMSSVVMKYTGVACCADNGTPRLLNANIKGTYNNIADYLEVVNVHTEEGKLDDYIIRVKAGKELPNTVKSVIGYVEHNVSYVDGTSEIRRDKITINISDHVKKYTAETVSIKLADVQNGQSFYVTVFGNKQPVKVKKFYVDDVDHLLRGYWPNPVSDDGKMEIQLNPTIRNPRTITFKIYVTLEGSVYEEQYVNKTNGIPVTVKIKVTK